VANKLSKEERERVIEVVNSKAYCDLPVCKIVPLLADKACYIASESTMYRILREEKQLKHRCKNKQRKHKKPDAYEANGPNQVWTWDISYLPTTIRGVYFYLYMIVDIYSRKIVGHAVHTEEKSEHAAGLIKQACLDERIAENTLILHSDNGSPMRGCSMMAMLEKLGVKASFSRPSVSDDNPYSEALFRTVKYHESYPTHEKFFEVTAARRWTEKFTNWYNYKHLHSALKFITPAERHEGQDVLLLEKRHEVYTQAQKNNPARWSRKTRNWSRIASVSLNAYRKKSIQSKDLSQKQQRVSGYAV
jgi:transposase InsO family protein